MPPVICLLDTCLPSFASRTFASRTLASRHLPPGQLPPVNCLPNFCLPSLTCLPDTCLPSITIRPSFFTTNKTGFRLCLVLRKSSQAGYFQASAREQHSRTLFRVIVRKSQSTNIPNKIGSRMHKTLDKLLTTN